MTDAICAGGVQGLPSFCCLSFSGFQGDDDVTQSQGDICKGKVPVCRREGEHICWDWFASMLFIQLCDVVIITKDKRQLNRTCNRQAEEVASLESLEQMSKYAMVA